MRRTAPPTRRDPRRERLGTSSSAGPKPRTPAPPGGGDVFGRFDGTGARYWDNVRSWPTVEPAIDFTATTPLAFALLIEVS
jgi:hypothetical protein